MLRPTDARADAPNVAVSPTSARPITNADAVMAVRRGFRIALARASVPGGPSRRSGAPIVRTAGRATAGRAMTTPTSTMNAPSATTWTWSIRPVTSRARARPKAMTATPATSTSRPATIRRAKPPTARGGTSAMAATGGTRAARSAGITAATTVIPTPTTNEITTVRVSSTVDVSGSSRPISRSSWSSPTPSAMPASSPSERRHRADEEGLDHHRPDHLTTGRAHRPQQPELAGPLRHEDGEGVEDDERTDHDPDGGEAEERIGEEPEELSHGLRDLDGRLGGGQDVVGRPERGLDPLLQDAGGHVRLALHVDRVDRGAGVELTLRGRQVEGRERHRAEVGPVAESEEADDLEPLRRPR